MGIDDVDGFFVIVERTLESKQLNFSESEDGIGEKLGEAMHNKGDLEKES